MKYRWSSEWKRNKKALINTISQRKLKSFFWGSNGFENKEKILENILERMRQDDGEIHDECEIYWW